MTQKQDKMAKLAQLAREVRDLTESPLYQIRRENGCEPVVGEGDPDAEIVFVGEAPGKKEAETGRPFVGSAGRIFDSLLESIGLDRQRVYVTNVVKDRPPDNRDPRAKEIELYAPFLLRQLDVIRPSVIATLGRIALDLLLAEYDLPQKGQKIGDLHGQPLEAQAPFGKVVIVPLYHPAAAFYNQELESTMYEDFQALKPFV